MTTFRCIRRLALALLAALVLFGGSAGTLLARAPGSAAPIDLAALVIAPGDMQDPGFARFSGLECSNPAGCAQSIFLYTSSDEAALDSAKLRRGYTSLISRPGDVTANTNSDSVETTILEFADAAKAKTGLSLLLPQLAGSATPESTSAPVGSGSELFVIDGPIDGDAMFAGAAGVRFRSGRLAVSIDYRFAAGHDVDPAAAGALAVTVLDRIEAGNTGTGLGSLIVRHIQQSYEAYDFVDGAITPTFYGLGAQDDARAALYENAGMTDVYIARQDVIADNPMYATVEISLLMAKFEDEDSASAYLERTFESAAQGTSTIPDGAPSLGDQSAAILVATEDWYAAQYVIRYGTIVVMLSWDNYFPDHLSAEDQLIEAQNQLYPAATFTAQTQVACLEAGKCPGLAGIPNAVMPQL